MNAKLKKILKPLALLLLNLGFDPRKLSSYKYLRRYKKDKKEWLNQGGNITRTHMILFDYFDNAGNDKGHYFHQDLLVAKLIHENKPKRHIDIASRVDGFVAHVASFREIEVFDVRPLLKSEHENIKFRQADLMNPQDLGKTDSISCLHAIEHFGLGRYTDKIDIDGHNKGITNLVSLVSNGGRLYISFPIGQKDEVYFNAHRVFNTNTIFEHPSIKKSMKLVRFDYVDDDGNLHLNSKVVDVKAETKFGCGIYTFQKVNNAL
ncbi:DUF268 domain-containing protein [Alphaproteobacteria bacterium]|nr:DUF268 domain-containing protein [Alphaproteobacteria bacterium]